MTLLRRHGRYTLVYSHLGRRKWWATGEADKTLARKKAKAFLSTLRNNDFEEVIGAFSNRHKRHTFAEVIDWYSTAQLDIRHRTRKSNIACLKRVLKACNVKATDDVGMLTKEKVVALQGSYPNPITANSLLLQASTVFTHHETAKCPALHVKRRKVKNHSYEWPENVSVESLMMASRQWRETDHEVYMCFLMGSQFGLRASEMVAAKRDWVNGSTFHVQCYEGFKTKSGKNRKVPMEEWVREYLLAHAGQDFLLPGHNYSARLNAVKRLNHNMTLAGWTRPKKCHELRKLVGAQIATQHGIYAAQKILGHSSVKTTEKYYADLAEMPKLNLLS